MKKILSVHRSAGSPLRCRGNTVASSESKTHRVFFIITLLTLAALPLRAQEFQWANNFSGQVTIVCTETDPDGNVYLFGRGQNYPTYQGEALCGLGVGTFLLKLDPNGNRLWRKSFYQTQSSPAPFYSNYMTKVGDTAIMMIVDITLCSHSNGLYYLDTLLPKLSGNTPQPYPFPKIDGDPGTGNAIITLDFDGNLLEHHFLRSFSIDSTGASLDWSGTTISGAKPFCVDRDGNLYISKLYGCNDLLYRIMPGPFALTIDGKDTLRVFNPGPKDDAPMIVKLAPHCESIQWCRPFIKDIDFSRYSGSFNFYASNVGGLTCDDNGDFYVAGFLDCMFDFDDHFSNTYRNYDDMVDTSFGLRLLINSGDSGDCIDIKYGIEKIGYFAKYNADGDLLWHKEIDAYPVAPMRFIDQYYVEPLDAKLNATQDRLIVLTRFVQGTYQDTTQYWNLILDADSTRNPIRHHVGFLSINTTDGSVATYGFADASWRTDIYTTLATHPTIELRNNQIFTLVDYYTDLKTHDTTLTSGPTRRGGMALMRWHEDGQSIGAVDLQGDINNTLTAISFTSSGDLILTGIASNVPTFGDLTINEGTFVTKLSDTTFNKPYTPEPREQSILWEQELTLPLAAAAVPLTARATSGLPVAYTVEDPTVARLSHDTLLLLLAPGSTNIYADQPGDLWWLPAPQFARTLTVTTTPDPNAISPVSPEEVLSVEYYDLLGRSRFDIQSLPRGVYIERTVTTRGVFTRKVTGKTNQ